VLSLITAVSQDNVIGVNNDLPWYSKRDLGFFREFTLGKYIICGKNTWDGIYNLMDGRKAFVLSTDKKYFPKNAWKFVSPFEVLNFADKLGIRTDCIIIGGSKVYESFLPFVDRIYLTKVHQTYQSCGETYSVTEFPLVSGSWEEGFYESSGMNDIVKVSFHRYEKKNDIGDYRKIWDLLDPKYNTHKDVQNIPF
jgi:dihydrofolate reductase